MGECPKLLSDQADNEQMADLTSSHTVHAPNEARGSLCVRGLLLTILELEDQRESDDQWEVDD